MKRIFTKLFVFLFLLLVPASVCWSQSTLDCDSIYLQSPEDGMFIFYEKLPFPKYGLASFYESIKNRTRDIQEKGKVFVQFVVDTSGQAQCVRVVRTENEILINQAVKLIKESEFVPAEKQGKKIISTMILPISFGLESSYKKKE
jgi:hypothetical protein